MNCIVCDKDLKNVFGKSINQPEFGLTFTTVGNYGSIVFDPMDGSYLEVNICDECLKKASKEQKVLLNVPEIPLKNTHTMEWKYDS